MANEISSVTRILTIALSLYGLMVIFTFGHAMSNSRISNENGSRPDVAVFSSILWPFYWSWEFQLPKP